MNATELTASLAQKLQITNAEAAKRLDDMVVVLTDELLKDNTISFSSFGSLEVKKREERISVNPVSGKRMLAPPKLIVKFKVSGALKERLKKLEL